MKKIIASLYLALTLAVSASESSAFSLKGTVFEAAGRKHHVDPCLIYSIALVESAAVVNGSRQFVAPSPWALRTDKPYYPKTLAEAKRILKNLLRKHRSVDVGLCQINTLWHGHRVAKISDLLDPQVNANIAAKILSDAIERYPGDAVKAIGAYHSGDARRARWYANNVLKIYTTLKDKEKEDPAR